MTVANDALAALVRAEVKELLGLFLRGEEEHVKPDDDLLELGFDSISLAEFVASVDRLFGVELAAATIFEAPSLRQLADHLLSHHRPELLQHYGGRVVSAGEPDR
jgi:acyl carrier protein